MDGSHRGSIDLIRLCDLTIVSLVLSEKEYSIRGGLSRGKGNGVSVKFSSVIHLTVDNYYLRGFGLISISVSLWQVFPWGKKKLHKRLYALPGILAYSFSFCALPAPRLCAWLYPSFCSSSH